MMNYHPICMQILRKEEKNMQQESVLNVRITKSFLLFWNHYDIYHQFYFRGEFSCQREQSIQARLNALPSAAENQRS